jgi:hypothetical protein
VDRYVEFLCMRKRDSSSEYHWTVTISRSSYLREGRKKALTKD